MYVYSLEILCIYGIAKSRNPHTQLALYVLLFQYSFVCQIHSWFNVDWSKSSLGIQTM